MSFRHLPVNDALWDYIRSVTLREPDLLQRLRDETASNPRAVMQITPEQGQFMSLLLQLMNAKRVLEIGVFTGYSSLITALTLPDDGRIIACDVSEEWTSVARRYWREAGVERKIDLRLAPALETLDSLIAQGQRESFDFAFIDADKANHVNYYERALVLIRRGGLIAVDNVLWSGRVIDNSVQDEDTQAIRNLNAKLKADDRVSLSMLPIGDGLTLAMKR